MAEAVVSIVVGIGLACVAFVIIACLAAIGWLLLKFLWEVFFNDD